MVMSRYCLNLTTRPVCLFVFFPYCAIAQAEIAVSEELPTFGTGGNNQSGLTFSPDGDTAYWVEWNGQWGSAADELRVIYTARLCSGTWSSPEPAPLSRRYSNDDPFVSPDGKWLYFVSRRPNADSDAELDADIWRISLVKRDGAERLSVNSDAAEYSPVVTASGALYFASDRQGGPGQGDLYRAPAVADGFGPPEPLGPAVNSPTGEWNLWVSADESELIFEASSRPTNVSVPGDLYYSTLSHDGWRVAVPIDALNGVDSDLLPRLHPAFDTLYYTTAPLGGHARIASIDWEPVRAELRATIEKE